MHFACNLRMKHNKHRLKKKKKKSRFLRLVWSPGHSLLHLIMPEAFPSCSGAAYTEFWESQPLTPALHPDLTMAGLHSRLAFSSQVIDCRCLSHAFCTFLHLCLHSPAIPGVHCRIFGIGVALSTRHAAC